MTVKPTLLNTSATARKVGYIATKARHARSKHILKHKRAHSKVGNHQFGIVSCIRCGGDVAVEQPLFMGLLCLCDGCTELAEKWALAQSIVQRNCPVAFGTHNEKEGFATPRTTKANGHPNHCTCERCAG